MGWVVTALAAGPMLLVAASYLGNLAWWLDLWSHFRPHLGVALLVATLAQLAARPRWPAAAWGAGAVLALGPALPYLLPYRADRPAAVTLVHANLGQDGLDAAAFAAWLNADPPDLLLLQEATEANLADLRPRLGGYNLLVKEPRGDTRGVAALARGGTATTAIILRPTPDSERPMIQIDLDVAGVPTSILSFSAKRPAMSENYAMQRDGLRAAAGWARVQRVAGRSPVVVGDFNATEQGALVRAFAAETGLSGARRGRGPAGTWPARLPAPLRIGIDSLFYGPRLDAASFAVGPDVGSDHLPLRAGLTPAPATGPAGD